VSTQPAPAVDPRDTNILVAEFQNRRRGYLPAWNPPPKSAGAAIGPIFARFLNAIVQRLNQTPARNRLALLDLLGLSPVPPQPARAPIVFSLAQGSAATSAPEGTQVAAPPPPGSSRQIVFSTEQDVGVTAASLTQAFSLWPGRDQYIDHSAALAAGTPFTLFQNLQLQPTDHILYLGHSRFLAFAGTARLKVAFDLAQPGSSPLELIWEYWDGKVWRGFITNSASCLDPAQAGRDGTAGLTDSGAFQLDVQGAQTAPVAVNGVSSYWIRARLTQALLPDPNQVLPEVETIRLQTQIDQRLELKVTASYVAISGSRVKLELLDDAQQPLAGATVRVTDSSDPEQILVSGAMQVNSSGEPTPIVAAAGVQLNSGVSYRFEVSYLGISGVGFAVCQVSGATAGVIVIVKVEGLLPDKAYADAKTLDTTKAFSPLGANPAVGSVFYFKQAQILSKPGAVLQLYVAPGLTGAAATNPISHSLNWEYWNGYEWTLLFQSKGNGAHSGDFTVPEILQFTVPNDMVPTKVNNEDGLWIRVRLVAGGYGATQTIALPAGSTPASISIVQRQPPVVSSFRFGYSWVNGPYPLEQVLAFNDFQYTDRTAGALFPGNSFPLFQPLGDVTPAFYLGFDQQLPVNNFGAYLDIAEQPGVVSGPALVWEYWNGAGWEEMPAEDETQQLALSGMVTFLPAADSQALARFGKALFWIRGRQKADGPPNPASVNRVYTNAVWASQWQTFANSPLGVSTGVPNQIFQFNQIPILPGPAIEVQELSGRRANTEWRGIVLQSAQGGASAVTDLESLLAAEGAETDLVSGNVRLVRDKTKSVTQVWLRWQERENFFDSGPEDRVYVLDHSLGRLFFGNGEAGLIPPSGALIQAASFRSGGGLAGNVPAGAVAQLLGAVSGIRGVANPRAAEGGADGETLAEFQQRAPSSLRNRGRAIAPQDYEALARQASAGVAVARVIPASDSAGATPGWITVMIIPRSQDPRPVPSAGLRQSVRDYLAERAPFDVASAGRINVTGPVYRPVDVSATLAPVDPARAGTVEQDALAALAAFLNPLTGGPGGMGWDIGRGVYLSDVAGVLGRVSGVDYVRELALLVDGIPQGDRVETPPGQIVVAGQLKVSLELPDGG
jgi:uncharacterized phage protein gp47/JayE